MTLSASLTEDTSGLTTTRASSAGVAAVLNPPSIPAGESIIMKLKLYLTLSTIEDSCSPLTASLFFVCAAGSRYSDSLLLSLTKAFSGVTVPSTTSTMS